MMRYTPPKGTAGLARSRGKGQRRSDRRFVLSENEHAAQVAIEAIGKRDVNDAIHAAERNGRLGTVASQGPKALSLAASQEHAERVAHQRRHRMLSPRTYGPENLF